MESMMMMVSLTLDNDDERNIDDDDQAVLLASRAVFWLRVAVAWWERVTNCVMMNMMRTTRTWTRTMMTMTELIQGSEELEEAVMGGLGINWRGIVLSGVIQTARRQRSNTRERNKDEILFNF